MPRPSRKSTYITRCDAIEEIISVEKLSEAQMIIDNLNPLGKLQYLEFEDLPNLTSIHLNALPFRLLKEMFIYDCAKVKKLPLHSNNATECKFVMKVQGDWCKGLQWDYGRIPRLKMLIFPF
ncbi:hypothetical protein Patl1_34331 [Pistacia atlantica]|uniref:Uncharacterized protein n=1 Tax=Pistacia atlantica TaxID=434234 RepID=A0ACC0ZU32_9ROSI|nr:hypothetical protein Patl1_34331 [Pistacia atlantica]